MSAPIVERRRGAVAALHAAVPPDARRVRIWVMEVSGPALVLGSTQSDDVVHRDRAARAGIAVVRRRSGGGAVLVRPDDLVWLDIWLPRRDSRWSDDVAESFAPIGAAWQRALAESGAPGTRVHAGPMQTSPWSSLVCFAGVGPGEVLVGEAKVVGISQRRTRDLARFQCALLRVWDPEPLAGLLRADPPVEDLAGLGWGIGRGPSTDDIVDAVVRALT